jgi:CDP-diacylglycerol--glycerol-3-phosphate 3-phosphatidyltransferase
MLRLSLWDVIPVAALAAYVVPALVVFLVLAARSGMRRSARIDAVPASPYVPRLLMEFTYWVFEQPVAICRALGITPAMISYASVAVTVGAAVALGAGLFAVGGWVLLLSFALDSWDGLLARRLGTSSNAGEFLDATIDRYNDLIAFFGLLYYWRNDPLPLAITAAALLGSTLTSYTRAKGEALGIDPNVGYMQRHERAVYLGLGTLLAPLASRWLEPGVAHPRYWLAILAVAIVAIASNVTALMRARYVLVRLEASRELGRASDRDPRGGRVSGVESSASEVPVREVVP